MIGYLEKAIDDKRNNRIPHRNYVNKTIPALEKDLKNLKLEQVQLDRFYNKTVYEVSEGIIEFTRNGFKPDSEVVTNFEEMLLKITGLEFEVNKNINNKYTVDYFYSGNIAIFYGSSKYINNLQKDSKKIEYIRDYIAFVEDDGLYERDIRVPVIFIKHGEELKGISRIIKHFANIETFWEEFGTQDECVFCDINYDRLGALPKNFVKKDIEKNKKDEGEQIKWL